MGLTDTIIAFSVALLIIFLISSTLIIPFFRTTFEEGFGTATRDDSTNVVNEYCLTNSTTLVTCADCNNTDTTSAGYETFLSTCHSLVARLNGTYCFSCSDWGFKTESRGLLLLIFVLGMLSLALVFVKKR